MKKLIIGCATLLICMVGICTLFAFSTNDKPKPKEVIKAKQTVCFVCTTPEIVKSQIDAYSKLGYTYKDCIPQSVSTSVNSRNNTADSYCYPQRDLYGKFILIMEK